MLELSLDYLKTMCNNHITNNCDSACPLADCEGKCMLRNYAPCDYEVYAITENLKDSED